MRRAALAASALLALSSCALVLDYGDFRDTSSTGTGGTGGAGGTAGTGGSGGGVCSPGTQIACYEGETVTLGVGTCKEGTKACNADGTGYAPCVGQVLPAAEICANTVDESCDAVLCAETRWNRRFGDALDQVVKSVALDDDGNILLTGWYTGTLDLGPGAKLGPTMGFDSFVAKLDPGGSTLWANPGPGGGPRFGAGVVAGALGRVVSVGSFGTGSAEEGYVTVTLGDGSPAWEATFGGMSADAGLAVAVDPGGSVYVTGRFEGTVTVSGTPHVSAGKRDIVLIKYDSTGVYQWSRSYGGPEDDAASSVAADPSGNVLLTGEYRGIPAAPPGLPDAGVNSDIFAIRVSPLGDVLWARGFIDTADTLSPQGASIAVDDLGNALLTGRMSGVTDFSKDGSQIRTSLGGYDVFVAMLHASTGDTMWSEVFGGAGDQEGSSVAIDGGGTIQLAGTFSEVLDFDPEVSDDHLLAAGARDLFLARLTPSAKLVFARSFGAGDEPPLPRTVKLATSSLGDTVLTGGWGGVLDFGAASGKLLPAGSLDAFVAKFAP